MNEVSTMASLIRGRIRVDSSASVGPAKLQQSLSQLQLAQRKIVSLFGVFFPIGPLFLSQCFLADCPSRADFAGIQNPDATTKIQAPAPGTAAAGPVWEIKYF